MYVWLCVGIVVVRVSVDVCFVAMEEDPQGTLDLILKQKQPVPLFLLL